MTPRSIRRAAERKANKLARKTAEAQTTPAFSTASPAQLAANRENAQLSSGPATAAGKARSSLNAVKSALTGRTVLLPSDDAALYETELRTYQEHFQPIGPEERDLVQSLTDISWRLNRIPGLEMAIYAQGRIEFAEQFEDREESLRPALIDLETFLVFEKQLRNLQLQEARLVRRREKETAELRRLQKERQAHESPQTAAQVSVQPAATLLNRAPQAIAQLSFTPSQAEIGFEFSNAAELDTPAHCLSDFAGHAAAGHTLPTAA